MERFRALWRHAMQRPWIAKCWQFVKFGIVGVSNTLISLAVYQLALNALEAAASLLTPTAPRCPHMGCALKWNAQEHSWDCPCHGSRFTQEGGLIENPAMRDLELEG